MPCGFGRRLKLIDAAEQQRFDTGVGGMVAPASAVRLSKDVQQAEQHDREGQHSAAIDSLVAGVHKQDVEAITRLGLRLLVGDRAPQLQREAIGFLVEASALGGAQAAAQLAVCLAAGVTVAPDIGAALRSLVLSAERGWLPAQEQLQVLGRDAGATCVPDGDASVWQYLSQQLPLEQWLAAPPAVELCTDPVVRSYAQFAGPAVCRWITQRARPRLSPALVYDADIRQTTTHATRTNSWAVFDLLQTDLPCLLLQHRIASSVGQPLRHFEALSVLHYDVGEQISEHFDFIDPNIPNYRQQLLERGQRVATFLVYLNEDYDGGVTQFPRLDITHQGRAGSALQFINALPDGMPDVRTLHAGRAPTHGEKWIVSQFIKNQPAF